MYAVFLDRKLILLTKLIAQWAVGTLEDYCEKLNKLRVIHNKRRELFTSCVVLLSRLCEAPGCGSHKSFTRTVAIFNPNHTWTWLQAIITFSVR